MVYISSRAIDTACISIPSSAIEKCQQEATTPYCWPADGNYICYPNNEVEVYWPPAYFNEGSEISIQSSSVTVKGIRISEQVHASSGKSSTHFDLDKTLAGPNKRNVNITLVEYHRVNKSYSHYTYHQGPMVSLVDTSTPSTTLFAPPRSTSFTRLLSTPTQTPSATSSPTPSGPKVFTPGEITGIGIGAFCALVFLVALAYRCGCGCCLACCFPGDAERRRVRAVERLRVAQEREYAQPHVDPIKAAVARVEVWQGPVRSGGMWVSRSNWPAVPARVARLEEGREGDGDEITAVDGRIDVASHGELWMEEQRRELERIEAQRREERRVEERREEIVRTDEGGPPAYEPPPPKYML